MRFIIFILIFGVLISLIDDSCAGREENRGRSSGNRRETHADEGAGTSRKVNRPDDGNREAQKREEPVLIRQKFKTGDKPQLGGDNFFIYSPLAGNKYNEVYAAFYMREKVRYFARITFDISFSNFQNVWFLISLEKCYTEIWTD